MLGPDAMYSLTLEVKVAIECLILQADVPIDIEEYDKNIIVLSRYGVSFVVVGGVAASYSLVKIRFSIRKKSSGHWRLARTCPLKRPVDVTLEAVIKDS